METKHATFMRNQLLEHVKGNDSEKKSDIVMYDGSSNVQLEGRILSMHYPKLTIMRGVEQTVSFFPIIFLKYPMYIE